MVGWHHRLNGYEFEQTPGDSEGQVSLVCCSPWNHKESKTTEELNNHHTHQSSFVVSLEHSLTPPTLQYWHLIGQRWMNSSWGQMLLKLAKNLLLFSRVQSCMREARPPTGDSLMRTSDYAEMVAW